jgi:L-arabinose isomerase
MLKRKPKIGLLALTLELYETLVPDLRTNRENWLKQEVIPKLADIADISFDRAVFTEEQISGQLLKFQAADCDAVMVICLTYSPSLISVSALKKTNLPILIWNTQQLYSVGNNFSAANMTDNHGVHGTQDLCSVLLRASVKFEYITSHLNDTDSLSKLKDYFMSVMAVNSLRKLKVGLIGYPFPGMGDFVLDTTYIASTLGLVSVPISVQEFIDLADSASQKEVGDLISLYKNTYELTDTFSDEDIDATARAELSMRAICQKYNLGAFSYQFLSFGEDKRTPTLPFVAASRLMADGFGFAGEGDIFGAAGTYLLNSLNEPATFSEIFTIDFDGNSLFMSHMGEANAAMAQGKIKLVGRTWPITKTLHKQLALAINIKPGKATFYVLTMGNNDRYRIICSLVDIADYKTSQQMEVPYFKVKPKNDVRDFLTAYAYNGGPHHNAVCFGDARNRLKITAKLINADYIEI